MILIRFALVGLIIFLLVRSFMRFGEEKQPSQQKPEPDQSSKSNSKKVSKEIGEYIDYEDVDK